MSGVAFALHPWGAEVLPLPSAEWLKEALRFGWLEDPALSHMSAYDGGSPSTSEPISVFVTLAGSQMFPFPGRGGA